MATDQTSGEAGFTLIEIIVGLAILTVSLTVLLNVISDGVRDGVRGEATTRAGLLAQSLLAQVGTAWPIRAGDVNGSFAGGFRWRLHMEPYGGAVDRQQWPVGAFAISAAVSWDEGLQERSVALATIRLAPREASP